MHITYTAQKRGLEKGKRYRNPRYFSTPKEGATKVTVVGNWPKVVAAYKKLGVPVEIEGKAATVTEAPAKETDWRKMAFPDLVAHAKEVTGNEAIKSRDEAEAAMNAHEGGAFETPDPEEIEIPEEWETARFFTKRSIAKKIFERDNPGEKADITADNVDDIIRAELKKRGA